MATEKRVFKGFHDERRIYHEQVEQHRDFIAEKIDLSDEKLIIRELVRREIVDGQGRRDIDAKESLADKGKALVDNLLANNCITNYECFFEVWKQQNPEAVAKVRQSLDESMNKMYSAKCGGKKDAASPEQPDSKIEDVAENDQSNLDCNKSNKTDTRAQIHFDKTWFRLRHSASGLYVNLTERKTWTAATLGSSRDDHFIMLNEDNKIRICARKPRHPGYSMLQSAQHGPIYLDRKDDSDTQRWYINKFINLRDGDEVKFRNAYWPGSFLCEYSASPLTTVFCLNRKDHDWALEVVDEQDQQ